MPDMILVCDDPNCFWCKIRAALEIDYGKSVVGDA